jgi:hypothetical protein
MFSVMRAYFSLISAAYNKWSVINKFPVDTVLGTVLYLCMVTIRYGHCYDMNGWFMHLRYKCTVPYLILALSDSGGC